MADVLTESDVDADSERDDVAVAVGVADSLRDVETLDVTDSDWEADTVPEREVD